jgi:hypothetical protein
MSSFLYVAFLCIVTVFFVPLGLICLGALITPREGVSEMSFVEATVYCLFFTTVGGVSFALSLWASRELSRWWGL